MVETYNHQIWTSKKYQQERDAARVAPGACAQVSLAAELDRFHHVMGRGVCPASLDAVRRLGEKISTYVKATQQRYPAWATRVTTQLGDRVRTVGDDLGKIGNAKTGYNNAVHMFKSNFEIAWTDIEDWMARGGETRLSSRPVDMLVASLRELATHGQRLTYVMDQVDTRIWSDARRYGSAMDARRAPDRQWLEDLIDLRNRLRAV